jgi:hypothetical protein
MKLENVRLLIDQFESGTLPKEDWTHSAHCVVALWYCVGMSLPQAVQRIRDGIKAYNSSVGTKNTDTSGYHETITLFFTTTITRYLITEGVTTLSDEQIAVFLSQPFLVKDYILQFYDKELLMSKEARRSWMEPRLASF